MKWLIKSQFAVREMEVLVGMDMFVCNSNSEQGSTEKK